VTIDLPVDANLPSDYVTRDDVRMEAYRRLGAVETPADVDDVRDEWEDRYGPPPPPAEALLAAARLRAECVRLGIASVTVSAGAARLRGLDLVASKRARLERLAPGAKVGSGEVLVPLQAAPAEVAGTLTALLRELVPVASATP
jgi:transcription-repair coupling factor (superfamily II helicase)